MEEDDLALRVLIRSKLSDGRLPQSIARVWGGFGNNGTCDACGETISKTQLVIEGTGAVRQDVQFHVRCFYVWDSERRELGRGPM